MAEGELLLYDVQGVLDRSGASEGARRTSSPGRERRVAVRHPYLLE
jgi:hypothetical protein